MCISSLIVSDGEWCNDKDSLKVMVEAVKFFHDMHSSMTSLGDPPSSTEIHNALLDTAPLKAPGHDGLHAEFFQRQWSVVQNSVCQMVR
ncbi:hypothetical protein GQ457_02G032630 [Hibiscus cannabinus]